MVRSPSARDRLCGRGPLWPACPVSSWPGTVPSEHAEPSRDGWASASAKFLLGKEPRCSSWSRGALGVRAGNDLYFGCRRASSRVLGAPPFRHLAGCSEPPPRAQGWETPAMSHGGHKRAPFVLKAQASGWSRDSHLHPPNPRNPRHPRRLAVMLVPSRLAPAPRAPPPAPARELSGRRRRAQRRGGGGAGRGGRRAPTQAAARGDPGRRPRPLTCPRRSAACGPRDRLAPPRRSRSLAPTRGREAAAAGAVGREKVASCSRTLAPGPRTRAPLSVLKLEARVADLPASLDLGEEVSHRYSPNP
ncbi:unnamed protein product [Rangifer tarandus platyrhynchus]|uniref:Uncharacterized protein n=2 Tax=Rangifer tarandus platyrhynchus TaxID=3082113 RepID=A0ABN8XWK2_RANTA|nr:unnamed protein product [Rangifer tarandus platyrhynchus]CAI9692281.1 unnamed protein product [Rangifer tarandus platyrhynchus]